MEDDLCILLFVLISWLILYVILEFQIVNKKKNKVKKYFKELNDNFEKRLDILTKMLDIVKAYDKNQFDEFGSNLYDYTNNYQEYDFNKKLEVNEIINNEIKKLLLASKVYPELQQLNKYVKLEKQLIRIEKVLNKLGIKYNKVLNEYNSRKKIFPSSLVCTICRFYSFNYYNINK